MKIQRKLNFVVSYLGIFTFFYALYIFIRDILELHNGTGSYFGYDQNIFSVTIVVVACLAPLCFFVLASFAYFNKPSWYAIPLALLGWFFTGGFVTAAYAVTFFIWQIYTVRNSTT